MLEPMYCWAGVSSEMWVGRLQWTPERLITRGNQPLQKLVRDVCVGVVYLVYLLFPHKTRQKVRGLLDLLLREI